MSNPSWRTLGIVFGAYIALCATAINALSYPRFLVVTAILGVAIFLAGD